VIKKKGKGGPKGQAGSRPGTRRADMKHTCENSISGMPAYPNDKGHRKRKRGVGAKNKKEETAIKRNRRTNTL